jgi:hypothetical protein
MKTTTMTTKLETKKFETEKEALDYLESITSKYPCVAGPENPIKESGILYAKDGSYQAEIIWK